MWPGPQHRIEILAFGVSSRDGVKDDCQYLALPELTGVWV